MTTRYDVTMTPQCNDVTMTLQVWMLTGDKLETATNIAISSRLVSRMTPIYQFQSVKSRTEAHNELNNFRKHKFILDDIH